MPHAHDQNHSSDFTRRNRWAIALETKHHEVLRGLLCGLSVDEAATKAGVTDRTVRRWVELWCDQTSLPSSALLVAYAMIFRPAIADDESMPSNIRTLLQRSPRKNFDANTIQIIGREVVDRGAQSHQGRLLLNPIMWDEIARIHMDLRYGIEALAPSVPVYQIVSKALGLGPSRNLEEDAKGKGFNVVELTELQRRNSALFLPISLAMSFLGTPLSKRPTEYELAYESDFGFTQATTWARERQSALDFEKIIDRAFDAMLWQQYSYELRHKIIPAIPESIALSSAFRLSPMAGMFCAIFTDIKRKWGDDRARHQWEKAAFQMVASRRNFLRTHGIQFTDLVNLLEGNWSGAK